MGGRVLRWRSQPLGVLRRLLLAGALILVLEYLVLPQLAGARRSAGLLRDVSISLVLFGVALEVASLAAYAALTRSLLPRGTRPRFATLLRIQLSTKAVTNVVPGGAAAGGGLAYRLLTAHGVPGTDVAFALAIQSIGSAVVLNALLWVGLVVSIPLRGVQPLYTIAALLGVLLLGAFATVIVLLVRGEEGAIRLVRRVAAALPFLEPDATEAVVRRLAERTRQLVADRRLLATAIAWAAANWLLDAASLWVFLAGFGHRADVDALLVAYGLANVLAAIPITPGGLGIIEGVLVPTLVGFGAARGVAILGVISWRLVSFWLPIPLGGLAYLSLRLTPDAAAVRRAAALEAVAEQARREAERPSAWARRVGLRVGEPGGEAQEGRP